MLDSNGAVFPAEKVLIPFRAFIILKRKKGENRMAKAGRPRSEDPKDSRVTIRLREQDLARLQKYADEMGLTKSEVLSQGLDLLLKEAEKK